MPKPVIFLAFANDRNDYSRYLRNIPEEYNAIRNILIQAQEKGLCDYEMLPYSSFEDIKNVFTRPIFRNRIAIFHFSGHADSLQLMLEDQKGENQKAFGQGLIDYFKIIKKDGIQSNLQALFFNGCCTKDFAYALEKVIPAIIATESTVDDAQAKSLAVSFYHNICQQIELGKAFELAKTERHIEKGEVIRGFYRQKLEKEPEDFPWKLQATEQAKNWKLQIIPEKYKAILLTSPPFDPPYFIGREAELESVHQKLFDGQNFLMLVNGQGGIGKTSFASKYWEKYQNDYSHLAFLFVENGIANAILSLSRKLALEFTNETQAEQLDILIETVSNLQKPCLLILDNANNEKDLNENIILLRKCTNFHILMTSRLDKFEQAQKHAIGALSKENALLVFKKYYEHLQENETPLFYQIFDAVGGNTLLIELFAKNLSHFNNKLRKKYALQNLLDDLAKGLTKLSQSKEVHTAYQAKGTGFRQETPEAIMLAMYDLTELSEAEKTILSVFAVLPAENIAFELLENMLKDNPQTLQLAVLMRSKVEELGSLDALKGFLKQNGLNLPDEEIDKYLNPKIVNFDDLDQNLLSLAQKGWIEYNETGASFKCNPLVQEICRHKNQHRLFADCEKMILFLIEELHPDNTHKENYKYSTLYSHYAESIAHIFQNNAYEIALLFERIAVFYETIGNINKSLVTFSKAHQIYENRFNENPQNPERQNNLAISYSKLGDTQSSLGNLAKALDYFEKFKDLEKELCESYPTNVGFKNGLAISYSKLGDTQSSLGNLAKALDYFEKRSQLGKELYESYPTNIAFKNGLAIAICWLGITHSSLGNLEKALPYFEKYNDLEKELYESYPTNVGFKNGLAISYEKLGQTQSSLGNLAKALDYFEKCNDLEKELYEAYPTNVAFKNGLAVSYLYLGQTQEKLKDTQKAKNYYSQGLKLYQELVKDFPQNGFQNNLKWVENRLTGL